jgi:hypothetical protein
MELRLRRNKSVAIKDVITYYNEESGPVILWKSAGQRKKGAG